jgi:hypothetical protein
MLKLLNGEAPSSMALWLKKLNEFTTVGVM